jgi:glycosyltransferase involved in cell wall biosynthesis
VKILFLTPQLPYPPISGGVKKSFELVDHLSSKYEMSLACILKSTEEEGNLAEYKLLMPQLNIWSQSLKIPRSPINLLRSYITRIPLTIFRNQSVLFKDKIASLVDDYDVIFVDHYLMFQYVPLNYQGRVIVHQHNAEFVMWSGLARQTINPLKKLLLKIEAFRIKNYEVRMCNQANVVLAAPNDRDALSTAGAQISKFIDTYHLGDEDNLNLPSINFGDTALRVLFIGTLTWEANSHGLLWFLNQSWPLIKKRVPSVRLTIAGVCTDSLKKRLLRLEPDAQLLNFVDDLEPLYKSHRVFVAPLRFGSGIKVKVVNALYRGMPTVTTEEGAAGLLVKNREHLFIEQSAVGFANSVILLLKDRSLWQKFSNKSRLLMRETYTWDVVFNNISRALHSENSD